MGFTVSEVSVYGKLAPRWEHHGGRAWDRKAAFLMALRKQRILEKSKRRREDLEQDTLQRCPAS